MTATNVATELPFSSTENEYQQELYSQPATESALYQLGHPVRQPDQTHADIFMTSRLLHPDG